MRTICAAPRGKNPCRRCMSISDAAVAGRKRRVLVTRDKAPTYEIICGLVSSLMLVGLDTLWWNHS